MRKSYDIFDIAKIILAIIVVGIHTLSAEVISPWSRIAVPLFFMMSSFLFFQNATIENLWERYKRFALRNLQLYVFWLVLYLPYTIYEDHSLKNLFGAIFLGGYGASWYLVASIVGMAILCLLLKACKGKNILALIVSLLLFAIGLLSETYNFLIDGTWAQNAIKAIPFTPSCSFFISTLWFLIGKVISDRYKPDTSCKKKKIIATCVAVISIALLYLEWTYASDRTGNIATVEFLSLLPLCSAIMVLFTLTNIKIPCGKTLRKYSTLIFCNHFLLKSVSCIFFKLIGSDLYKDRSFTLFALTLALSVVVSFVIIWLREKKGWRILAWAY